MTTTSSGSIHPRFLEFLKHLQHLRHFNEPLSQYWQPLLDSLITICDALAGQIYLQAGNSAPQWKTIVSGSNHPDNQQLFADLATMLPAAVQQCDSSGYASFKCGSGTILAVNLIVDLNTRKCIALFRIPATDPEAVQSCIDALLSVNDLPALYRMQQAAIDALKTQSKLTDILDIMTALNTQHRFVAAAMTVCNELATRFRCDRVSLGWMKKDYVRIAAMSHTDQFEKKMDIVEKLEMAMEEARDQNTEILFPAPDESGTIIVRDHELYAHAQDVRFMATLPLREKDTVVALIALERNGKPFTDIDLRQLRVTFDQFTSRLVDLRRRDKWIGARLAGRMHHGFGAVLGYEHTWAKVTGIASFLMVLAISFIPVPYRVSSPMILRTDDNSYLTVPFDGYIDSVACKPGDFVTSGSLLLSLDNRDLLLELAALLAEKNREQREIEKARAAEELADMCIAQARFDQVVAKIEINKFKLGQAAIVSPFDGIVIEGDLKEKRGSPVKQGEILFKVGRITNIFSEAKVHETEIQNITLAARGQIALSSRPQDLFGISVALVEPSATISENKNVFLVRCSFQDSIPIWFRPGMTGISKINAGKKTTIWIIAHRTIDFLRLKLWW